MASYQAICGAATSAAPPGSCDHVEGRIGKTTSLHFPTAEGQIDPGDAHVECGATRETCHEKAVAGCAFDGCCRLRVLFSRLFLHNRDREQIRTTSGAPARGGRRRRGNAGTDR